MRCHLTRVLLYAFTLYRNGAIAIDTNDLCKGGDYCGQSADPSTLQDHYRMACKLTIHLQSVTISVTFNSEHTGEAETRTETTASLGDSNTPKPQSRTVKIGTNDLERGGTTVGNENDGTSRSEATPSRTRAVIDAKQPVQRNFKAVDEVVEVVHVPDTPEPPKSSQTEPERQEFSFSKVIP